MTETMCAGIPGQSQRGADNLFWLDELGQRHGAVRPRRQEEVLAVGRGGETAQRHVRIGQIVAPLEIRAIHQQTHHLVML